MRFPTLLTDTIARRFALSAMLTVAVTLVPVFLFNRFAGVLASEPLNSSGLLAEVTDLARVIEASPPALRPALATAASSSAKRIEWTAAGSPLARAIKESRDGQEHPAAAIVAASTHHPVEVWETRPEFPSAGTDNRVSSSKYGLAVQLTDGSWLLFAASHRIWGLSRLLRWTIWAVFLGISISATTFFAARKFAIPVKDLAAAVREFGVNTRAPPLPETGPREFRQVIRTFNVMKAQIQQFVSHRTTMLAAISHDLRTPLTRMRLRGELIEDRMQQSQLFRDVDEMQAMVDGALAFFRDDAEHESVTIFDLANLLLTIQNDFADQRIEVEYEGPMHLPYQGRPFALKRAFTNLVENAHKYASTPQIRLERSLRTLEIVVCDNGPGIPEEVLPDVFLPYFRVEKSRNRNTGGIGLGLTVAQAIVHSHGGSIILSNRPTGGLEACVSLPVSRQG